MSTRPSLFADQEREDKLNRFGNALEVMEQHVDFVSLAAEVDLAAPRSAASAAANVLLPPN